MNESRPREQTAIGRVRGFLDRQPWNYQTFLKVWSLGMAIRVLDIFVMRPICADTTKPSGFCMPFFGDGTAMYGAAQLARMGKIGFNPIFYTVTGGDLVATAAKPPVVVAVLTVVSWIGAGPLALVGLASVAVAGLCWNLLRRNGRTAQATLAVQLILGIVVVLRLVGGQYIAGARLGGALYASIAICVAMAYAKRLAGKASGIAAGVFVAISPAVWVNDTGLNVEVAAVVGVLLVMFTAQLVIERWSLAHGVWFGLASALAVLSRFELVVIVSIVGVYLLGRRWVRARTNSETFDLAPALAAVGVAAVILTGYGAWNIARIGESSGGVLTPFGSVMSQTACDRVMIGDLKGLYAPCMLDARTLKVNRPTKLADAVDEITEVEGYGSKLLAPDNPSRHLFEKSPPVDVYDGMLSVAQYQRLSEGLYQRTVDGEPGLGVWVDGLVVSDPNLVVEAGQTVTFKTNLFFLMSDEFLTSQVMEKQSRAYISEHAKDLPSAVVARLGRVLGLYRTNQSIQVNAKVEGQGTIATVGGLLMLWIGLLCMPFALVKLRRAGASLVPLWAPFVQVLIVCAATYGIIRYRLSVDLSICVLLGCLVGMAPSRPVVASAAIASGAEP
jgi:hypothetical protein